MSTRTWHPGRQAALYALLALAATIISRPALADDILVFKAPNTWSGQQGGENLVYHRLANPGTWRHYRVGSAFYDTSEARFVIGADATDTGGWNSAEGFYHSELTVGRSVDGINFNDWRTILWVNPTLQNFRIYNLSILPDPARPGVWFGLFGYTVNGGGRGTARIEIDNVNLQVRVSSGASSWTTYSLGAQMTAVPYRITGAIVYSFARVTVDGVSSYEMWTIGTAPRSGLVPCSGGVPTATYTSNTSTDTVGRKLARYVYSPVPPYTLSGPYDVASIVRPMPTDYDGASISLVTRHDYGTREAIFSATTDQRICDVPDNWNPWSGSSVRFTRIFKQADGSFREEAGTYFLNIKNPNWTCVAGITTCYAPNIGSYAFVGAYPVVHGGNVYFYVESWGGFVPQ